MPGEHASSHTRWGVVNAPIARLAAEQRGVVARDQLRDHGWSETTIDRRILDGLLTRLWPATYAYGHANLGRDGWLLAATMACGAGSQLVARAAAAARGLMSAWSTIDVATPHRRGVELDGIRTHRLELRPEERDVHRGLPVTSLARTALDIAASESPDRVGELLDRALLDGQYDHAEMLELLDVRRGCRGVAILRREVAKLGDEGVVFRSRPERLARDLLLALALPQPAVNAWFPTRAGHGYELDFWWPALPRPLDLEIDGPHHRQPRQRRLDRLRDAELRRFGVSVVRVPSTLVTDAPEEFRRTALRVVRHHQQPVRAG